ncbi:hypothetical protein PRCB_07945 [Pantoea rodasii]|uniref:Uncharacterized protein n=1 Tax=Pantoea rodasii TaxID=1076549 RepID=A0A2M9WGR5_9GAMM|nr:hypothetical protein HA45_14860 [Pantoea rodasii]PJZ06638.1 hypothetical protein PRCB_07945 [Pantoea rodasii]
MTSSMKEGIAAVKRGGDNTTMNLWAEVCEVALTSLKGGIRAHQIKELRKKSPQLKSCYS